MQERKAFWVAIAHNNCRLKGKETGVVFGVLPDRCFAFFDVHLAQRERHESDVPVGAIDDALDDVSMNDAGEGAAVVPCDGELKSHGDGQPFRLLEEEGEWLRTYRRRRYSGKTARAMTPSPSPTASPPATSDA